MAFVITQCQDKVLEKNKGHTMYISAIEQQYCEQPTGLLTPDISIEQSDIFTHTTPYKNIIDSALLNNPEVELLMFGCVLIGGGLLIILLKKPTTRFLVGLPILSCALLIFTLFKTELLIPYAANSAANNGLHKQAMSTLNSLFFIFDRIEQINNLPQLARASIIKKKIQLRQINSYLLAHGVKYNIRKGHFHTAVNLADTKIFGPVSDIDNFYRSVSHWETSRSTLEKNYTASTLKHAEAAYRYDNNSKTEHLTQIALLAHAKSLASSNQLERSLALLVRIRKNWEPDKQKKMIEYIARHEFINRLENKEPLTHDNLNNLLGTYKQLLNRFDLISLQKYTNTVFSCDMAGLYNILGALAFHSGQTEKAIAEFLSAEALIKDSSYTKQMLVDAYTADGHANLVTGNNLKSLSSFKSAYQRESSKERGCNVSLALNAVAIDLGNRHDYTKAFGVLKQADALCHSLQQTPYTRAELHFSKAEYFMGNGQFNQAAHHFKQASKNHKLALFQKNILVAFTT